MSATVVLACLWVVAAAATAFLPMRYQVVPGLALLVAAPVLVAALVRDAGWGIAAVAVFAVGSMFRRPLWHLAGLAMRRARGGP